jgi:hypothetical protein
VTLALCDPGKSEYLGEILLSATLWPRTQEDKDQVSDVILVPLSNLQFWADDVCVLFKLTELCSQRNSTCYFMQVSLPLLRYFLLTVTAITK